ncbi:hypothetical protein tloyanaT_00490 [Thalassotalea loyana]|uniref:PEP-CTERM sorting domain-containing protein n=1 Tax=Thalassotalea loyana TaxID=280483 RepID=A0ABQ6H829_9GAMM|nr:hypothetical protein [Thalassotalea loyana]GLX83797.1 hypothetical protein tloyanaT_00490 [Thalassotalea loyana]
MGLMKLFSKAAALATLLLSLNANADLITVEFQITNYNSEVGTFTGVDIDNNALLTFDELTDFDWSSIAFGHFLTNVSDLTDFGDFNLLTNTWIPNGTSWVNSADNAYFTRNNRSSSVNSSWGPDINILSTTVVPSGNSVSVPEPSALAILVSAYSH